MRRSSVGRLGIGLLALSSVAVLGSAQSPQYTFRRTVRRVVVDVVVTDGHHNMIHGLEKSDFQVYEDSRKQELRSFETFNLDGDQAFVPPPVPALPPDTFVDVPRQPERGPLYVIVYDAVNMELTDQVFARKTLENFLATLPAGTRFELYYVGEDARLLQGFTSDPQALLTAFDVKRKEGHIPWVFLYGANYGSGDFSLPFQVMVFIAKNLAGLPGRKNLIWMSSSFPVPFMGQMGAGGGATVSAGANMDTILQQDAIREASDTLNQAQISVYPINVQGLNPQSSWGGIDQVAQQLADATGGQAYYNRNDVGQALDDATENGGSYYEMTYEPPNHEFDGKLHRIRVALTKPGYQMEYRQYYFDDDPDKPLTKTEREMAAATAGQIVAHHQGDSLYAYMVRGAPMAHDVLFRAQVHASEAKMATAEQMADLQEQPAFFVLRKRSKPVKVPPPIPLQPYTIDYLVMDQTAAMHAGQVLEFAACAYNADGKMLNGLSQNAARAQAETPQKAGDPPLFRAEQTLEVPTTARWLRVAVRDVATDRIGTIEIRLPLATHGAAVQQAAK
jgi:VWFA-related protein